MSNQILLFLILYLAVILPQDIEVLATRSGRKWNREEIQSSSAQTTPQPPQRAHAWQYWCNRHWSIYELLVAAGGAVQERLTLRRSSSDLWAETL